MKKWLVILILGALLVFPAGASTTYYVATNGNDGAAGTDWNTALATISNAVGYATANDTVLVSNGVHQSGGKVANDGTNMVYITAGITVRGFSGIRTDVIVDGGGSNRCFWVNHNQAVIRDLTIRNGYVNGTTYGGGGMYLQAGLVTNCLIVNNSAGALSSGYEGGGLYLYPQGASYICRVDTCTITGNTAIAYAGGGLCLRAGSGVMTINNCTIVTNTAVIGGGIYMEGGTVQNCPNISHNVTTSGRGGGIYATAGLLANCVISNNSCPARGGGLAGDNSTVVVSNCVFIDNYAADGGGGVQSSNPGMLLRNCLITRNVAGTNAGGVYFHSVPQAGRVERLDNCTIVSNRVTSGSGKAGGVWLNQTNTVVNTIVYSNSAASSPDIYVEPGDSQGVIFTNCCTSDTNGLVGTGNLTNYPQFLNPAVGNWRLGTGSPAIDTGTNEGWMDTAMDLDGGHPRILGPAVDMGAYEYPLPDTLRVQPIAVTADVIQGGSYVTNLGVWFTGLITNDIYWGMTITSSWLSAGPTGSVIVYPQTNDVGLTNTMLGLSPGLHQGHIAIAGTNWMSANYPPLTNAVDVSIGVMAPDRVPTNQTFTLMQGYAATSQSFQVWNAGAGAMSFGVTTNQRWLSVNTNQGVSTGAVDVATLTNTVAAGLGLGTYYGEVHVQPDAGGALRAIGVTVSVNPAPELRVSPGAWDLTTAPGRSPADTALALSNASSLYSLDYTIASNVNWVFLDSPASGNLAPGGSATVSVKYQTATLSNGGTYTGALTVTASNGAVTAIGSPQTVAIIVHVNTNPLLQTTPTGLTNAVVVGRDAADQYFEVWNGSGTNALAYTVADNVPWLVMSPASGTSTGQHGRITVRYSTAGLNPGETSAVIAVRATDGVLYQATNQVSVTLRVQALAELATTMMDYNATIRQGMPLAPLSFQIWNSAASPRGRLIFTNTVTIDPPASTWLTVNPGSGTSAGEAQTVTLSFNTAGLGPLPRPHRGVVRITGVDEETGGAAVGSPREFTVEVTVNRGVGLDFTGQGSAALVVYHEPTGMWYLKDFMTGATWSEQYGGSGFQPVVGDYDGDGKAELGLYAGANAALYVKKAGDSYIAAFPGLGGGGTLSANIEHRTPNIEYQSQYSGLQLVLRSPDGEANRDEAGSTAYSLQSSYVPFAGDYDGDGKTDPAVFSDVAGYWWVLLSQSGYAPVILNTGAGMGYTPVSGDFDGDGIWDPAVYQSAVGSWYALLSGAGYPLVSAAFGGNGESPVTGDYDGDGLTDPGIFNPTNGVFSVLLSANRYTRASVRFTVDPNIQLALHSPDGSADRDYAGSTAYSLQPISGDYDGDGRADPTVYTPDPAVTLAATNGYWQIMLSGNAYVPMPFAFGPRRAQAVGQ